MYMFWEFIVYKEEGRNNTLKIHKNIALNKDADIGGSQIPVMWQYISKFIGNTCIPVLFTSFSC